MKINNACFSQFLKSTLPCIRIDLLEVVANYYIRRLQI
jgi:hypothetical protein